jgi:uncharacterized membrane protein YoaK (UPF0700 family)
MDVLKTVRLPHNPNLALLNSTTMTITLPESEKESFSLSGYIMSDGPARFMLSWVAGFVDTASFIILFALFTAHVTGNIALAGASVASSDEKDSLTHLLMIPIFMVAVALTSILARYCRHKNWPVLPVLLTAETIGIGVFLIVASNLETSLILDVQEEIIFPIGAAGVVAMAIQNALMKEAITSFTGYFPTTVMTGNTTQLTLDLVLLIIAPVFPLSTKLPSVETEEALARIGRVAPIIAGFFLGAAAAAYSVGTMEFSCLIFPLIVIAILTAASYADYFRKSANS